MNSKYFKGVLITLNCLKYIKLMHVKLFLLGIVIMGNIACSTSFFFIYSDKKLLQIMSFRTLLSEVHKTI